MSFLPRSHIMNSNLFVFIIISNFRAREKKIVHRDRPLTGRHFVLCKTRDKKRSRLPTFGSVAINQKILIGPFSSAKHHLKKKGKTFHTSNGDCCLVTANSEGLRILSVCMCVCVSEKEKWNTLNAPSSFIGNVFWSPRHRFLFWHYTTFWLTKLRFSLFFLYLGGGCCVLWNPPDVYWTSISNTKGDSYFWTKSRQKIILPVVPLCLLSTVLRQHNGI